MFSVQFVWYPSDIILWGESGFLLFLVLMGCRKRYWREAGRKLLSQPLAVATGCILLTYLVIALLDSIHFVPQIGWNTAHQPLYAVNSESLLDRVLIPMSTVKETSYSLPWATHALNLTWHYNAQGVYKGHYAALHFRGLKHVGRATGKWLLLSGGIVGIGYLLCLAGLSVRWKRSWRMSHHLFWSGKTDLSCRTAFVTLSILMALILFIPVFGFHYHLFGTDKIGTDVLYQAIKSIRTGVFIGSATLLFMLPLALVLGISSGYYGGKIDDCIQYLYTTISAIPNILLIVAAVLAIQIFFTIHSAFFTSINQQADIKLLVLCAILGLTGWVGLCRLLRAETLKLREMDYVAVAKTLGVSSVSIMIRHILPNIIPLVLMTFLLDFSGLVLAEAILTYIGVGVDPSINSWGNMIDAARFELAREPVVWWPLTAAFSFMFVFVLSLNFFGDGIKQTLDP